MEADQIPARRATDPVGAAGASLIDEIKRTLRVLSLATIGLFVVMALALGYGYHRSNQITDSLCTLRADLQSRVDQEQRFVDHPEDFPQFNDPKVLALTVQQIDGQKRTIAALNNLAC